MNNSLPKQAFLDLDESLTILGKYYKPVFEYHAEGLNLPNHIRDYFIVYYNESTSKYEYQELKNDLPDLLIICRKLFSIYLEEYS